MKKTSTELGQSKGSSPAGARPATPGAGYYFIQVPVYLYEAVVTGTVHPSALVVYMTIVKRYALMDRIFPSYETLGRESGMSRKTAYRCLMQLRDAGALTWGQRVGEKGQSTNEYALAPWKPFMFDRDVPETQRATEGVSVTDDTGVSVTDDTRVEDFSPITETEPGYPPTPVIELVADAPVSGFAVEGEPSTDLYSQAAADLCDQIDWKPRGKNKQQLEDKLRILVPDPSLLPEILDLSYNWPQPDKKSVVLLLARVQKIKKQLAVGVTPMYRKGGLNRVNASPYGHEHITTMEEFRAGGWGTS